MSNPLIQAYRRPKAYIALPSKGRFYKEKPELSVDGELAVYPMTARDELITKNPDALFNGESTIALLKSCCPGIPNPKQVPICDLPMIMLGIRQATYGKDVEIDATCPSCSALNQVSMPVAAIAASATPVTDKDYAEIGSGFKVKLTPYDVSGRTKLQIQQIQQQKAISTLIESDMPEEEKERRFGELFVSMAELTVSLIRDCIVYVETPDGDRVDDDETILEWLQTISKSDYDALSEVVESLSANGMKQRFKVKCQECQHEWEAPVELDMANFFEG